MTEHPQPQVTIDGEDGRPLAVADIDTVDPSVVRASLHVEAGHVPVGTRTRLVDAVLDSLERGPRRRVQVSLPLGDTEILNRLRERCESAEARAAGASCVIEADLPSAPEPDR